MWDLDTLDYLNQRAVDRAHERAVHREQKVSQNSSPDAPQAPVFPLAMLSRLLITGTPSIGYILSLYENSEVILAFMELVCEYLPDHEDEIRVADMEDRIRLFAHHFGQRYFPLTDLDMLDEYGMEDFVRAIPVDLMGYTSEDYHSFGDFRTGHILLLSLVEKPEMEEEGARIPILTHVGDLLGRDVVALIPTNGWTPQELHELTDDTPFDGVGAFADWIHSDTGYYILDADHYDYSPEYWRPDIVSELTTQWPKVCELQDKRDSIMALIEEDPKKQFLKLLDILLNIKTSEFVVPDEQASLPLDDKAQVINI